MDQGSKEILKKITSKQVSDLSAEEKAFLRARRSYLSAAEEKAYEDVLEEEKEGKKATVKVGDAPEGTGKAPKIAKPKKGKKK